MQNRNNDGQGNNARNSHQCGYGGQHAANQVTREAYEQSQEDSTSQGEGNPTTHPFLAKGQTFTEKKYRQIPSIKTFFT